MVDHDRLKIRTFGCEENTGGDLIQSLVIDQFCRIDVLPDPVFYLVYGTFVDRPYPYEGGHETGQQRGDHGSHDDTVLQI